MGNWTIRRAKEPDAIALTDCMHAAYQPYAEKLGGITLPPMAVDYADEIRASEVWVAESGAGLAGGLVLVPETDHMKIANVAVHPDFQGTGLGRALMDFAEDQAITRSYAELRLATHARLVENVSLYTHLGWTETERDEFRVLMTKRVGA